MNKIYYIKKSEEKIYKIIPITNTNTYDIIQIIYIIDYLFNIFAKLIMVINPAFCFSQLAFLIQKQSIL